MALYESSQQYRHKVISLIQQTWRSPYVSVKPGVYAVYKKKFVGQEIDHTDGIGTKGYHHWRQRTFKSAVIDALAMNLNDLALMKAMPYKLQSHITIPIEDKTALLTIIGGLTKQCLARQIVITGGETSIQDTLDGMDLSLTVSGLVDSIDQNQFSNGDYLIGLPSSGLHCNGFRAIRQVFGNESRREFTQPTKIYLDQVLSLAKSVKIHGMMHITGGGFTKLKTVLADSHDAIINRNHKLKPQPIFYEIYGHKIDDKEMYKTFNCGIGFVLSVAEKDADKTLKLMGGAVIGRVQKGTGKIRIESAFSSSVVIY